MFKNRSGVIILLVVFLCCTGCNTQSATPTVPGTSTNTPVTYTFGLYDDFENGWQGMLWRGSAEIVDDNGNNVVKIEREGEGPWNIAMNWPYDIPVEHFQEWSARVKIPSGITSNNFSVLLDYHGVATSLSWYSQVVLRHDDTGHTYIYGQWRNRDTGQSFWQKLKEAKLDRWYELKMTIDVTENSQVEIGYYVNGQKLASSIPNDSQELINHDITGLHRNLGVYKPDSSAGTAVGLFDQVYGVYGDSPESLGKIQYQQKTESIYDGLIMPKQFNRDSERIRKPRKGTPRKKSHR